jgi:hypothetical protein
MGSVTESPRESPASLFGERGHPLLLLDHRVVLKTKSSLAATTAVRQMVACGVILGVILMLALFFFQSLHVAPFDALAELR